MGKWWRAEPHLQSVGSTPALKGFAISGEESPSKGRAPDTLRDIEAYHFEFRTVLPSVLLLWLVLRHA